MTLEPRAIPVRLAQALAISLLLALPGCHDAKKEPTKGTAGGEVLEASVSDAMLPVDQVRSQAPLAPRSESDEAKRDRHNGDAAEETDDSTDTAGAPAGEAGAAQAPPAAATPSGE